MIAPSVSVVIPAWNASAWIQDSLESVFAQSYPKAQLEIIVIDDASTDATKAAAQNLLADRGILHQLLSHEVTRGPSAARNTGWRAARGDWIQFLDADDALDPQKIATQAAVVQDLDCRVAVVFSQWAETEGAYATASDSAKRRPYIGSTIWIITFALNTKLLF